MQLIIILQKNLQNPPILENLWNTFISKQHMGQRRTSKEIGKSFQVDWNEKKTYQNCEVQLKKCLEVYLS